MPQAPVSALCAPGPGVDLPRPPTHDLLLITSIMTADLLKLSLFTSNGKVSEEGTGIDTWCPGSTVHNRVEYHTEHYN